MLRFLIILLFVTCLKVNAQSTFKARVLENKTRIGLSGIRVDNLNNKRTTLTDNAGNFDISAKTGDLLVFKGFAYKVDTLLITKLNEQEIFMEPVTNELNQVNIRSAETKNLNTYYDPQFHGQPIVFARDENMNYKGGLILRLWYWKKDEKKKARLKELERKFAIMDKINAVFQPKVIAQYIPLTGEDLNDFINMYTPNPKIVTDKDFNLINYLNVCLKKFQKLPPDKRHPSKLIE